MSRDCKEIFTVFISSDLSPSQYTFHRGNANSDYDTRSYLWHHEAEAGINESCRITLTLVRETCFLCVTATSSRAGECIFKLLLSRDGVVSHPLSLSLLQHAFFRNTCTISVSLEENCFCRVSCYFIATYDSALSYFLPTRNLAPIATCQSNGKKASFFIIIQYIFFAVSADTALTIVVHYLRRLHKISRIPRKKKNYIRLLI